MHVMKLHTSLETLEFLFRLLRVGAFLVKTESSISSASSLQKHDKFVVFKHVMNAFYVIMLDVLDQLITHTNTWHFVEISLEFQLYSSPCDKNSIFSGCVANKHWNWCYVWFTYSDRQISDSANCDMMAWVLSLACYVTTSTVKCWFHHYRADKGINVCVVSTSLHLIFTMKQPSCLPVGSRRHTTLLNTRGRFWWFAAHCMSYSFKQQAKIYLWNSRL